MRECMGAKLQSHIPAQVNMGYIFRKKMGPLHPRFKEKRFYFSRTISKNGHPFLPKWPLTMVTSFKAQAAHPVKLKCECATPGEPPHFISKIKGLGHMSICLVTPRNRQDKCYWFRLLKQGYWSLHKQWKGLFFTRNC